ncbi:MAG: hypothetical protein IPM92_10330 [Saprospiraceae bacterium]|nr:hypothetical protein [Saprospiraceae bacterium]
MRVLYLSVSLLVVIFFLWKWETYSQPNQTKICGLSFVAPPDPFVSNPMSAIKQVGANWLTFIPYAFSAAGQPEVRFENLHWQWWGERAEGIKECIRLAKAADLNIMLKPQVYIHRSWVGAVEFHSEEEWQQWEQSYTKYMMLYVDIAKSENIAMLCIATEYDKAAIKREAFFRKLIREIRSKYSGKLCYSANWDHYSKIPFWDALDYIGISAYFPLADHKNPNVDSLKLAWIPYLNEMEAFSKKCKKSILFSEFGYLSVDGSAGKTWELEKNLESLPINETSQATAYEALFSSLWNKSWWAGGFLWKWFPEGKGHEGFPEKDYTPQGKQAETVLKYWYDQK